MAGKVCKACGSSELDVDPARGDTVCMNCGTVLEDSVIVSEVQFEEGAGGVVSAIGHFVSSESSGGCRGFGSSFLSGSVKESRDITLINAKRQISQICDQLRLNQHCLETAFNFYKMALMRQFTRGRKSKTVFAACIYLTCRIEGTPHLLIDLSDLLQISPYQLGRTYVTLTQSLCINVPSIDPCIYVLRYAGSLELGDKTHEVSTTALRIVQRMMKDSIHTGRRPSGVCGAALLLASRLHSFNRTVNDIVRVVQVHETTLRKRLLEFGETPSSSLTLKEFLTTDLLEEQDPPSFKAARLKDEMILKELNRENLDELETEIDQHISTTKKRKRKFGSIDLTTLIKSSSMEEASLNEFVQEATYEVLKDYLDGDPDEPQELGPDLLSLGVDLEAIDKEAESTGGDKPAETTATPPSQQSTAESQPSSDAPSTQPQQTSNPEGEGGENDSGGELDVTGLDDDELESYIMPASEVRSKNILWYNLNSDYLLLQKEKEKLKKEAEEGKPEKKKKKTNSKKKDKLPANSAGEAIEKMLQEKRISAKINYDVLKSLSSALTSGSKVVITDAATLKQELKQEMKEELKTEQMEESRREEEQPSRSEESLSQDQAADVQPAVDEGEEFDEVEEPVREDEEGVMSVFQMFNKHQGDDGNGEYYNEEYDEYY